MMLDSLPYSMERDATKQCHIFFSMVLSSPDHALLRGPLGCSCLCCLDLFPLFPAHITAGLRSALPGTGLRLLLAPIQSGSMSQGVALLWVSSTGGPTQAERGHPAHSISLPACPCCAPSVSPCPATLEAGRFVEKPPPNSGAAPARLLHVAFCLPASTHLPQANFSRHQLSFQT